MGRVQTVLSFYHFLLRKANSRGVRPCQARFQPLGNPAGSALKAVFHWISRLHWAPNATKNETNNMKSTWPTPAPPLGTKRHLYYTCVHRGLALRVAQILAFLDTNMLVSQTRNCGVGGLSQCEDPSRMVLRHSGI